MENEQPENDSILQSAAKRLQIKKITLPATNQTPVEESLDYRTKDEIPEEEVDKEYNKYFLQADQVPDPCRLKRSLRPRINKIEISEEISLPVKRPASGDADEPQGEKKAKGADSNSDNESYNSDEGSGEEYTYEEALLSDEGEHEEDQDFDMEGYLAFKAAEEAKEKEEADQTA